MLSRLIIIIPGLLAQDSVSLTFTVDLEVNNDWLHSSLAVPPQALSCLPAHFSHQELSDTPRHRSCPEELVLNNAQTDRVEKRKK